jgi:hypothetical protein
MSRNALSELGVGDRVQHVCTHERGTVEELPEGRDYLFVRWDTSPNLCGVFEDDLRPVHRP